MAEIGYGTSGQTIVSNGSGNDPSWRNLLGDNILYITQSSDFGNIVDNKYQLQPAAVYNITTFVDIGTVGFEIPSEGVAFIGNGLFGILQYTGTEPLIRNRRLNAFSNISFDGQLIILCPNAFLFDVAGDATNFLLLNTTIVNGIKGIGRIQDIATTFHFSNIFNYGFGLDAKFNIGCSHTTGRINFNPSLNQVNDWAILDLSSQASLFAVGDTITGGTSGATATFKGYNEFYDNRADFLLTGTPPLFLIDEIITGGTSGATARVVDISPVTANTIIVDSINGTFSGTEIITGSESGLTATFTSQSNFVAKRLGIEVLSGVFQVSEGISSANGTGVVLTALQKNKIFDIRGDAVGAAQFSSNFINVESNHDFMCVDSSMTYPVSAVGNTVVGTQTQFFGTGFLDYKSPDGNWEVNTGITESKKIGSLEWVNNATTTTTPAGVFTKTAGATYFNALVSQRFDMPLNNRLRYLGKEQLNGQLFVNGSALGNGGSAYTLTITIYKNGTQLLRTLQDVSLVDVVSQPLVRAISVNASTREVFALSTLITLNTNDYLEIFLQTTGSETPRITNGILSVI